MKRRIRNLLWAFIVGVSGAQAQNEKSVFSIKDCIEYASTNSPNIKNSRLDEDIAKFQNQQVRSRGLPQAAINATWQNNVKRPQLVLPPAALALFGGGSDTTSGTGGSTAAPPREGIPLGLKYNSNATAEVTQMIFDPSFWVGLKAAKYNRIYAAQNSVVVNEQTSYNIANAYYQVIVVQKQLRLLQDNLKSTDILLQNTQLQFSNGVAKQVDVKRITVNANNLRSQVKQTELNLIQALNNLKFQMGMPIEQQVTLSDTNLTYKADNNISQESPETYYENRNNYKLAKTNITLQQLDRKNNIAGYYPTLTGFGNYSYIAQGPDLALFKTPGSEWINYNTIAFGLRFRLVVFDGLQRNALVQQSKIKTKKLEENLALTKQSINLEVENARALYSSTLQRIDADLQNVALAEEVYKVTQLEFREGVGTSNDVVNSETSLRQAQNTYINTLLDLYRARLDMEKAKGNLITYLNTSN